MRLLSDRSCAVSWTELPRFFGPQWVANTVSTRWACSGDCVGLNAMAIQQTAPMRQTVAGHGAFAQLC